MSTYTAIEDSGIILLNLLKNNMKEMGNISPWNGRYIYSLGFLGGSLDGNLADLQFISKLNLKEV